MNRYEIDSYVGSSEERKSTQKFRRDLLRTINELNERRESKKRDLRTEQKIVKGVNKTLRQQKIDMLHIEGEGILIVQLRDNWERLQREGKAYASNPESSVPTVVQPNEPRRLLGLVLGVNVVEGEDLDKVGEDAWYISCEGFNKELLLTPISGLKRITLRPYKARFFNLPWPHF